MTQKSEIDEIVSIYKQFPHLRFGQFLENAYHEYMKGRTDVDHLSLYNVHDWGLLQACKQYAKKNK